MAGYNSLEGLLAKRVISAIGGNRRLRSGRFSYQIVDGGKSVRSGRCHIFIGAGHVTFVEPRNGDAFGWTLDEIDRVELQKRMMNTDILRVTTTGGAMIEVTDTVEMDGRQISAINDALKQTSGEMDPLRGLASFEFMVKPARQEAEVAARRADAITRGELLPEDMKALGESVDAYAPCTHLGTLLPPKGPEGPTFHGYVLAGGSCFGIILGQGQLYARFSYADVAAVAWRPVKADTSRWLVEFVENLGPEKYWEERGDRYKHRCIVLPALTTDAEPNVTTLIFDRIREQSNHEDIDNWVGPEDTVDGMELLPITEL